MRMEPGVGERSPAATRSWGQAVGFSPGRPEGASLQDNLDLGPGKTDVGLLASEGGRRKKVSVVSNHCGIFAIATSGNE